MEGNYSLCVLCLSSPFGEKAVMGSSSSSGAKKVRCTSPGLLLATQDRMLIWGRDHKNHHGVEECLWPLLADWFLDIDVFSCSVWDHWNILYFASRNFVKNESRLERGKWAQGSRRVQTALALLLHCQAVHLVSRESWLLPLCSLKLLCGLFQITVPDDGKWVG